jgi:hypothetical protein
MGMMTTLTAVVWLEEWLNMATRSTHRSRQRNGSLSPSTHISLTVVQFLAVVFGVVTIAGGYWWLEANVTAANMKVDTITSKVDTAIKSNNDGLKDQDNKREQLTKDFLASQAQIVAKVSDLNTSVQVQQHDTKTIADTLAKISEQLQTVVIAPSGKQCGSARC